MKPPSAVSVSGRMSTSLHRKSEVKIAGMNIAGHRALAARGLIPGCRGGYSVLPCGFNSDNRHPGLSGKKLRQLAAGFGLTMRVNRRFRKQSGGLLIRGSEVGILPGAWKSLQIAAILASLALVDAFTNSIVAGEVNSPLLLAVQRLNVL